MLCCYSIFHLQSNKYWTTCQETYYLLNILTLTVFIGLWAHSTGGPLQSNLLHKAEVALWSDQVAQLDLGHFQGQTLQKVFGQSVPCLTILTGEKVFIQ